MDWNVDLWGRDALRFRVGDPAQLAKEASDGTRVGFTAAGNHAFRVCVFEDHEIFRLSDSHWNRMIWCWFCHCFWLSFWKVWVAAGCSCGSRQWQHGRCGKIESVLWRRPIEDIPPCRDTLLHYLCSCHSPGRLSIIDLNSYWSNLGLHLTTFDGLKARQRQHTLGMHSMAYLLSDIEQTEV